MQVCSDAVTLYAVMQRRSYSVQSGKEARGQGGGAAGKRGSREERTPSFRRRQESLRSQGGRKRGRVGDTYREGGRASGRNEGRASSPGREGGREPRRQGGRVGGTCREGGWAAGRNRGRASASRRSIPILGWRKGGKEGGMEVGIVGRKGGRKEGRDGALRHLHREGGREAPAGRDGGRAAGRNGSSGRQGGTKGGRETKG